MPPKVWVSGEALIDLLPGHTPETSCAIVGGGPANTAVALAQLGVSVSFVGGLSKDRFGRQIAARLLASGVGLDLAIRSDLPTSLAIVSLNEAGDASYRFHHQRTATFDFDATQLPDPELTPPIVIHVGSLATVVEPGASHLLDWVRRASAHAPVVFDPNIRPSMISDRAVYGLSVQRWLEIANVVKASDDDLEFLYPGRDLIASASSWLSRTCPLVVVTRGEKGIIGITANEIIEVPAVITNIVDSVGAGDTVGAVIAEAMTKHKVADLHGELLQAILERAAKAAAITCSRAGCNPPSALELDEGKQ